jgi:hypothetical protein
LAERWNEWSTARRGRSERSTVMVCRAALRGVGNQPCGRKVMRIVFSFAWGDHDAWRRRLDTARFGNAEQAASRSNAAGRKNALDSRSTGQRSSCKANSTYLIEVLCVSLVFLPPTREFLSPLLRPRMEIGR